MKNSCRCRGAFAYLILFNCVEDGSSPSPLLCAFDCSAYRAIGTLPVQAFPVVCDVTEVRSAHRNRGTELGAFSSFPKEQLREAFPFFLIEVTINETVTRLLLLSTRACKSSDQAIGSVPVAL